MVALVEDVEVGVVHDLEALEDLAGKPGEGETRMATKRGADEFSALLKSTLKTIRHWQCRTCRNYFTCYAHNLTNSMPDQPNCCPFCGVIFDSMSELA